jgi:VanZ family protein
MMKRTQQLARCGFALCVVAILWLALSPNPPNPAGLFDLDKVNHVVAFTVLSVLLDYASVNFRSFFFKGLSLLMFGLSIEVLQFFVGYRFFELSDWLADGVGVATYGLIRPFIKPRLDKLFQSTIG